MNLYSIPPLITSCIFILFALMVFVKNHKSMANISYVIFALLTVWWQGAWAILFNIHDEHTAYIVAKVGYSGIIFLTVAYYHSVVEFLNERSHRKLVFFFYLTGVFFLIMNWTSNSFISGVYSHGWGFYPKAGILHPIYLLCVGCEIFFASYLLYRRMKQRISPIDYNQCKYIFLINSIYSLAAVDFFINYGANFYPFGFIPVLISAFIFAYAISKHHILDIFVIYLFLRGLLKLFALLRMEPMYAR